MSLEARDQAMGNMGDGASGIGQRYPSLSLFR